MRVAMLGSDFSYGVMPSYTGTYARSSTYLGDTSTAASPVTPGSQDWNTTLQKLLLEGPQVAIAWLNNNTAKLTSQADIGKTQLAIQDIQAGKNPVATGSFSTYLPWIIGGGLLLTAGIILTQKRRRRV